MSDDVTLDIDSRTWAFWDEIELHSQIDSYATAGFTAPFDPARKEHRDAFRPFSFKPVQIKVGGELLFTGQLVDVHPRTDAGSKTVDVSAYSLPAALDDINQPVSSLPFEANGLTLRQIAERMAQPFGISVVVQGQDGPKFKRVHTKKKLLNHKAEIDEKISAFLAELARQHGQVLSSDAQGRLVIWQSVKTGNPVARLKESVLPLLSVVPTFSPQSYYSEITGFTSAKRGRVGAKFTLRNDRLSGAVLRPLSFKLDDIDKGDAPAAVKAKMGRMFGNMVSYVVNLPTWRDPRGKLWAANTTLTLEAPGAMIYRETELLIRDVYLKQSAHERTASLGLVLPGAFSGEQPARLPWED